MSGLCFVCVQVSVNGLDKSGSTPLHWAAGGGHMSAFVRHIKLAKLAHPILQIASPTGQPAVMCSCIPLPLQRA